MDLTKTYVPLTHSLISPVGRVAYSPEGGPESGGQRQSDGTGQG